MLQKAGIRVIAPFHPDFSIVAHLEQMGQGIEAAPSVGAHDDQ